MKQFASTNDVHLVRLATPLPCSIWRGQSDSICGDDALAAYAWQYTGADYPMPGLWVLQPVCEECARRAMMAAQSPHTGEV